VDNVERTPIQELRIVAKTRIFRRAPEVVESINWLNSNRSELYERMHTFTQINSALNRIMSSTEQPSESLRDVRRLQSLLGGVEIPSLERVQSDFYNSSDVEKHINDLFESAKHNFPSWAQVNPEYPSQGTPAMGALIEGFGAYMGKIASKPEKSEEINRAYVLAFEELLIKDFSSSPLIKDVIGWMVEEKESFPEETQKLIHEEALNFNSS
jgi:hypothetical protein